MTADSRSKWDRIYTSASGANVQPARVLTDFAQLLPATGTALDFACGLGGNALWLAQRGLTTFGWDISTVALEKLGAQAQMLGLSIGLSCRDLEQDQDDVGGEQFDVVVVSRFLVRARASRVVALLKPNGVLFYQTYTVEKQDGVGPSNLAFLLRPNELLRLFRGLHVLAYRDEGLVGDTAAGLRAEAYLVAQRRP